ncbi:MAG: sodium:calcium antiporter [Chloroflexota bacterium]
MDVVFLVGAFIVILAGAELFTNGVEWFGHKLELAEGAVGSVLAAIGTALPETMIPLVAILFSAGHAASDVGVGAILGAPFMLATLAMFVTGAAVLVVGRRRPTGEVMIVDPPVIAHDMRWFAVSYGLAVGVAFLPAELTWPRLGVAAVLVAIYGYYVLEHLRAEMAHGEADLAPLRMHRLDRRGPAHPAPPRLRIVTVQVVIALGLIVLGAYAFVGAVSNLAGSLGLSEVLLALVIAPIATELPEKFNSVIWVRQGKDTLAMGNITGAMVFQSAIPTVIALVFAPDRWAVTPDSLIAFGSAGIALLSSAAIFVPMARTGRLEGRRLLLGGLFYLVYLGLVIGRLAGVSI